MSELFELLSEQRPKLVHITGKTCTGKSTLASQLSREFGYSVIGLDQVVNDSVINPLALPDRGSVFVEVYRNRDKLDWIESFVGSTQERISALMDDDKTVVSDGAVANVETLRELFEPYGRWLFAYLHPVDLDRYAEYLVARVSLATRDFASGLPSKFWQMVDEAEFIEFCDTGVVAPGLLESIDRYAVSSQRESEDRLATFQASFENVVVVNV